MSRKPAETQDRKKRPPIAPSTGQGAASALDALIKRRANDPVPGRPPVPGSKKS